ncbi:MAG: tetratricopeptide repeat protein [Pseudomonadota bacterium]
MAGSRIPSLLGAAALMLLVACDSLEERALKHQSRGLELLVAGESAKARVEFRNALRLDKTLVPSHLGLAAIFEDKGQIQAAVQHFGKAVDHDPANVEARYRLARHLLTLRNFEAVLSHGAAIVEQRPGDGAGYALRAIAKLNLDDSKGAEEDAGRALERAPDQALALLVRAQIFATTDRKEAAAQILIEALPDDRETVLFHHRRVHLLQQLGRFTALVGITEALTERFPQDVYLWQQHVNHLVLTGQTKIAEGVLRQMLAGGIGGEGTRQAHLRFVTGLRGEAAARAELVAEAERSPDRWDLRLQLAAFDHRTGRVAEAEALFETVLAEAPSEALRNEARSWLGRIALDRSAFLAAMAKADAVLSTDPDNVRALAIRAAVLAAAGEIDQALSTSRRALNETADDADLMLLNARILESAGHLVLATDQVKRALDLSNGHPEAVLRYARLLVRQGEGAQATLALSDGVAQRPAEPRLLLALGFRHLADSNDAMVAEVATQLGGIDAAYGQAFGAVSALGQGAPEAAKALLEDLVHHAHGGPLATVLLFAAHMDEGATDAAEETVRRVGSGGAESDLRSLLALMLPAENGSAATGAPADELSSSDVTQTTLVAFGQSRLLSAIGEEAAALTTTDLAVRGVDANVALWLAGIAAASTSERTTNRDDLHPQDVVAALTDDLPAGPGKHAFWADLARLAPGVSVGAFLDRHRWLLSAALSGQNAPFALAPSGEQLMASPWARYRVGKTLLEIGLAERGRAHLKSALSLSEGSDFRPREDIELLLQSAL